MIRVTQYDGGRVFRRFNVIDPKKIAFWKRMALLPTSGIITKVKELKKKY